MKRMYLAVVSLALILLSAPSTRAQDLSQYRNFSFGMSLAQVSKQIAPQIVQTKLVFKRPAIVQEVTWWPRDTSGSTQRSEPVWQILFTFYDDQLYRIVVTYDSQATKGLTLEDMVEALSTQYGIATRPNTPISFPTNQSYSFAEIVTARWENAEHSINLYRSSALNSYGLVLFSKPLGAQVGAAFTESRKLGTQSEDSLEELVRLKVEATDLEATRQKNKKTFRP